MGPSAHRPSPIVWAVMNLRLSWLHALQAPLSVERHARPSSRALAESILTVAHRNLHRREDATDWIPGVLGVSMARAAKSVAVPEVDR